MHAHTPTHALPAIHTYTHTQLRAASFELEAGMIAATASTVLALYAAAAATTTTHTREHPLIKTESFVQCGVDDSDLHNAMGSVLGYRSAHPDVSSALPINVVLSACEQVLFAHTEFGAPRSFHMVCEESTLGWFRDGSPRTALLQQSVACCMLLLIIIGPPRDCERAHACAYSLSSRSA